MKIEKKQQKKTKMERELQSAEIPTCFCIRKSSLNFYSHTFTHFTVSLSYLSSNACLFLYFSTVAYFFMSISLFFHRCMSIPLFFYRCMYISLFFSSMFENGKDYQALVHSVHLLCLSGTTGCCEDAVSG